MGKHLITLLILISIYSFAECICDQYELKKKHLKSINILNWQSFRAKITITESIPDDLTIKPLEETTYVSWKRIISNARESIDIACYYMTLTDGKDYDPRQGGDKGKDIYDSLIQAKMQHNVTIRIVQNLPSPNMPDIDTSRLAQLGVAQVRSLNFPRLLNGYISNS